MSNAKKVEYTAAAIEVLEGLEPVRKRPGMYIGGTEGPEGLHHLVKEIVDNSVDEAMNGHADKITVTLSADRQEVSVEDNGRGIPVDHHPRYKRSALELILTTLHAGGKFSDNSYKSAGGLHGVGSSVVNALSESLTARVARDGFEWLQSYSRGKPTSQLKKGGKTKATGTMITFRPDPEIFRVTTFQPELLLTMAQEKAFLNKGITVEFIDRSTGDEEQRHTFFYENGLRSYLESLLERNKLSPVAGEIFYLERSEEIKVEVAFCYTEATQERLLSYVNGIPTLGGGSHADGFRQGLQKALRNYIAVHDLGQKGVKLTGEDLREGLVALLSVNVPGSFAQLQFQGQTKDKLNNPEVLAPVESLLKSVENILNSKPSVGASLVERVHLAAKARSAARDASQSVLRKTGISHRLNLPGKLADCSSTRPEHSELFIVEGDSAGGTAKQGRDRKTQAVFPLRGKILNAVAASEGKLKENKDLLDLVSVLGCGYGKELRLDRLRYSKVIILTDADADGMHIAALLTAFFYRFLRPLVDAGNLYLGLPPLYRVRTRKGGKEVDAWAYSDQERDALLKKLPATSKVQVTRFKGLGEMNATTLWDTTLSPATRNLLKLQVDGEDQTNVVFEELLGRDPSRRYQLVQEYAHKLEVDV